MEVILKEDVPKLGSRGDVVKVAEGYGRNFLLPKKLAIEATQANKSGAAQALPMLTVPWSTAQKCGSECAAKSISAHGGRDLQDVGVRRCPWHRRSEFPGH
ncbi:MAG: hypothetical protein LAN70_01375 [Acidobacteriia bacterium]|nr:hypothetical protein [Terriglobia bacterium]